MARALHVRAPFRMEVIFYLIHLVQPSENTFLFFLASFLCFHSLSASSMRSLTSVWDMLADLRNDALGVLAKLVLCKVDLLLKMVCKDLDESQFSFFDVFPPSPLKFRAVSLHDYWLALHPEFIRDSVPGGCPQ